MRTSNRVAVISNTGGVNTVKYQSVYHSGVPSNYRPVARNYTNQTQLKPFSFDERDRRMLERKEQKIKEVSFKDVMDGFSFCILSFVFPLRLVLVLSRNLFQILGFICGNFGKNSDQSGNLKRS